MKKRSPSIPKTPALSPAADFAALWAEGLAAIEALGNEQWTDYNAHDPGITLMEAMAYAITDLGYRTGWSIADLLVGASKQAFFTAASILTVIPVTIDDYRRFFIDLDGVRNAWLGPSRCHCDGALLPVRGLYDVRLELDSDDVYGDLNDRTIVTTISVVASSGASHDVLVELRFPDWDLSARREFAIFRELALPFALRCTRLQTAPAARSVSSGLVDDDTLRRYWRRVFYATLEMESPAGPLQIVDISLRLFGSEETKSACSVAAVLSGLCIGAADGSVAMYREKVRLAAGVVHAARQRYAANRNLAEDAYGVAPVRITPVAVCADLEATPEADLERIQAEIWFAIEEYLSPRIPFYSLAELLAEGVAVEEIFSGPRLSGGFIKQSDLDAAGLRAEVRGSDLIKRIMGIKGVIAVNDLLMSSYDDAGELVATEPWLLTIPSGRQPRLYTRMSNFAFAKSGLPFLVDEDEALAVLAQLRGEGDRPAQRGAPADLPVPEGAARSVASITPLQYALPQVYGVSPAGLPSHVGDERRAQAKQLQAYLQVFEQILGDAFEQVAQVGELFSCDRGVAQTYFAHSFSEETLRGYDAITGGALSAPTLQALLETEPAYLKRRNRFLDHLMARFGEDFNDYALLLRNWRGDAVASTRLIDDKITFLAEYPELSRGRFKAFNHHRGVLLPENEAGLKRRFGALLGFPALAFEWTVDTGDPLAPTVTAFSLCDDAQAWLSGTIAFTGSTLEAAIHAAAQALLHTLCRAEAYDLVAAADGHQLRITDPDLGALGLSPERFPTVDDAEARAEELRAWASYARSRVVEHLLLRPKFPGDARYRECLDCEEDDPWSFRITLVMPGWAPPYSSNLDLRDFADRTLREELPSHLLAKICWVGNDGVEADPCDDVVDDLARLIEAEALGADGARPDCETARDCAAALYLRHADVFTDWFAERRLRSFERDQLVEILRHVFASLAPDAANCPLDVAHLWDRLQTVLIRRFTDLALRGWQFERFEMAWYDWVAEDARFDWGLEAPASRLEALLRRRLVSGDAGALCDGATAILREFGGQFRAWMEDNLALARTLEEFGPLPEPAIDLPSALGFQPGTEQAVRSFLRDAYGRYTAVSYRLTLLVRCLESLSSTYPAATLHDCLEGGDINPVRLGQTALGTQPLSGGEDINLTPPEP